MKTEKEILQSFISNLHSKNRSVSTITAYKKDILQLFSFIKIQKKDLFNIDSSFISDFIDYTKTKLGFSVKTSSRKLNAIRTFFKFLFINKFITEDPTKKIKHPKFIQEKSKYLSKNEVENLRNILEKDNKMKVIIELILQTGINISFIPKIQVQDIDFRENLLSIQIRKIHINSKIKALLFLFISDNTLAVNNFLFVTRNKTPYQVRNLRSQIIKYLTRAKLKNYSVNDLRNTFVVNQLSSGVNPFFLKNVLGLKSEKTLEKYMRLLVKKPKNPNKNFIVEV